MGKKKKEKKSKTLTVNFGGRLVKIKKHNGTDSFDKIVGYFPNLPCTYIPSEFRNNSDTNTTSIDKIIMESYTAVQREKFIPNEITGFSREFRKKSLIVSSFPLTDSVLDRAMRSALYLIINWYGNLDIRMCNKWFYETVYNTPTVEDFDLLLDVKIEPVVEKPGYFKLAKDSNTFYGLSKQMSTYIIDNCAALLRVMIFRDIPANPFINELAFDAAVKKYEELGICNIGGSSCVNLNTGIDVGKICFSNINDKRFIKWRKALDIRTAIYGDIESLLMNIDDDYGMVFFFSEKDQVFDMSLKAAFHLIDTPRFISPAFGTPVHIITNPVALYQMEDYGITLSDIMNIKI